MGFFDWIKGKRVEAVATSGGMQTAPGDSQRVAANTAHIATDQAFGDTLPPWLPRQHAHLPDPYGVADSEGEPELKAGGLDFGSAIRAHRNWRHKLGKYVQNELDERIHYSHVCRDDLCQLGLWINSNAGQTFSDMPSFAELKATHTQLHLAAGRIMKLHDEGKTDKARMLLRQGDYPRCSLELMDLLSNLYVEVLAANKRVA